MTIRRLLFAFSILLASLFPPKAKAQEPVLACATSIPTGQQTGCLLTSVVSTSAENSHVLKAAPGALYTVYATNLTATAGFLVLLNATAVPADGAILPLDCVPLPANNSSGSCGPGCTGVNYRPGPGKLFNTGIVAVVSSAATCFTKTTGTITAFISGDAL